MSYNEFVRRLLTIIAVVLFVLALWQLRGILMLSILSSIIAVSLTIPVNRLRKLGSSRSTAIFFTLVFTLIIIGLFIAWILPPLATEMANIVAEFPQAFEDVRDTYAVWYTEQSPTVQGIIPEFDSQAVNNLTGELTAYASPILTRAGNILFSGFTNILVVIVVSVFLLLDPMDLVRGVVILTPPAYRQRTVEIMAELKLTVTTWMTALTFSISITTFLVWFLLGIVLSVPNSLALGVIAGVMTIIPNVGAIIPLVPIVIFTIADDPAKLPLVIPAYLLVQFTESNILTPAIVRRQLNIPAALILIFQLIAASVFGFIGILLAVPMLAIVITLVRELYVYDLLGQRGKSIIIESDSVGKMIILERETSRNTSLVTEVRRTGLMPTVHIQADELPPEDMGFEDEDHIH